MNIQERIDLQVINALKSGDVSLSVLRMLKNALKNAEIEKRDKLTDSEVMTVLEKQAKQRKDSAEQFLKGGRADLAEKEEFELKIIESYLPKKLSREELANLVDETIKDLDANDVSQIGQVMKEAIKRSEGRGDGKIISEIVKAKLQ